MVNFAKHDPQDSTDSPIRFTLTGYIDNGRHVVFLDGGRFLVRNAQWCLLNILTECALGRLDKTVYPDHPDLSCVSGLYLRQIAKRLNDECGSCAQNNKASGYFLKVEPVEILIDRSYWTLPETILWKDLKDRMREAYKRWNGSYEDT